MMVLRHLGPPSATVVNPDDDEHDNEERTSIPMDLSNKHSIRSLSHELPRHLKVNNNNTSNNNNNNNNNKEPLLTIFPLPPKRSLSGKDLVLPSAGSGGGGGAHIGRPQQSPKETRWRTGEDDTSYSSPDSGLHRDSPGEDEDVLNGGGGGGGGGGGRSPPLGLSLRRQSLIPLSLIRARYNHNSQENDGGNDPTGEDKAGSPPKDPHQHVQTKRARLEEMVSHIKKTTKPERGRRHSGDDDTSSGGNGTSGDDEVGEDAPTDLSSDCIRSQRSQSVGGGGGGGGGGGKGPNNAVPVRNFIISNNRAHISRSPEPDDEPCNLVCNNNNNNNISNNNNNNNKQASSLPMVPDPSQFIDPKTGMSLLPKNFPPLSPSDASKMYGVDPETYQQQMMQLQLTSAAMLGDPGGLLKGMGTLPPWVYLGYYSQLIHSFQAQEILRQYAIQSQTPTISPGEKSPPVTRTLGSSGYNCRSPVSPASVTNEGTTGGVDSDSGSMAGGQVTGGNGNGKRAPRAMTGRHVRTGTGASPTTLQTLRLKIEERQRMKAQQLRHDMMLQPHANNNKNKNNSKLITKKFKK